MMKSFRSTRQIDRRADLPQIIEAALEIRLVGQHADAGRAVLLVRSRDRDRIEIGADDAFAGAGFFDFGDQPNGRAGGERGEKVARRRGIGQPPRNVASGRSVFARAISSRFAATILSRIVGMDSCETASGWRRDWKKGWQCHCHPNVFSNSRVGRLATVSCRSCAPDRRCGRSSPTRCRTSLRA